MPYPTFDQAETIQRIRDSFETVAWAARMVPADYTLRSCLESRLTHGPSR